MIIMTVTMSVSMPVVMMMVVVFFMSMMKSMAQGVGQAPHLHQTVGVFRSCGFRPASTVCPFLLSVRDGEIEAVTTELSPTSVAK